jgi:hypothetical protein
MVIIYLSSTSVLDYSLTLHVHGGFNLYTM